MCTVSAVLLPSPTGCGSDQHSSSENAQLLRIMCNRDEKRTRTEALPPIRRKFGERTAILPIDPLSRGTWIGVNDAGLALCILNATVRADRPWTTRMRTAPIRSRGQIIPSLLDCESVGEAIDRAAAIESSEFPPFRLIAASRTHLGVVASDQNVVRVQQLRRLQSPFMATSSGLGDELVDPLRRELFGECLRNCVDASEAQQRFHAHQWPDRKHLSVQMARADARTVSRTFVEVGCDFVRMTYLSLAEVPQANSPRSSTLGLYSAGAMA